MNDKRTCLFCGNEITPDTILFTYKSYDGPAYEDRVRSSFLESCSTGFSSAVGQTDNGKVYFKALYFRPSSAYRIEKDLSGMPINMQGVPLSDGLTPSQLLGGDAASSETKVTDNSLKNLTCRVCPHCHCELPQNFGLLPIISVAMIGGKSAGKTAYLLALTQRLKKDLSDRGLGSASLVGESEEYFKILEDGLLRDQGRTTGTPLGKKLFPFVFEYTSLREPENNCYVCIYDMAGESTKEVDILGEQMGLRRSNTVLLMLDANQFNEGKYFQDAISNTGAGENVIAAEGASFTDPVATFLAERIARYHGAHLFDHVNNVVAIITKIDQVLGSHDDSKLFASDEMVIKQPLTYEVAGPNGTKHYGYTHKGGLESEVIARLEKEVQAFCAAKGQEQLREDISSSFNSPISGNRKRVNVHLLAVSTYTRHPELETNGQDVCVFKNDYDSRGAKHRIIEPFLLLLAGNGRIPATGKYASRYSPRPVTPGPAPIAPPVSMPDAGRQPKKEAEKEPEKPRGFFGKLFGRK